MPVIKNINLFGDSINKFTNIDKHGRLRTYVEFLCLNCNQETIQRKDEYNRTGQLCKSCKIKNNSADKLKDRDLELVCAANYLCHIRTRYLKKGLTTNLNSEEVLELVKRNCHYCGSKPSSVQNYKQKYFSYSFLYNGLDRIDSKKGYIKGNVLPCCRKCNLAKSDLTYQEFIEHISKIYKNLYNASN